MLWSRAPFPLVELDIDSLRTTVRHLIAEGTWDVAAYLDEHPDDLGTLCDQTTVSSANPMAVNHFCAPSEGWLIEAFPTLLDGEWRLLQREMARALQSGEHRVEHEAEHLTCDGRRAWVRIVADLSGSARGQTGAALLSLVDLTREMELEHLHRELAEELAWHTGERWLQEAALFMSQRLGADLSFVARLDDTNASLVTLAACRDGSLIAGFEHPSTSLPFERVLAGRTVLRLEDLDGKLAPDSILAAAGVRSMVAAPVAGAKGAPLGIVAAAYREGLQDDRLALAAMSVLASRATAEMERVTSEAKEAMLEAQLVHAQRLESVGRLAGGIAHDFNNLLAPILAYAEMAAESLEQDEPVREDLAEIVGAAERASRVTRKLLAFSRRQVLDIRALDLNAVLLAFTRMIRTVIREDIHLELCPMEGPAVIQADEGQVEQILMNLILNAQDAMPDGGRLTISCHPHHASGFEGDLDRGTYVCLEVSDTGTGMDEATVGLIFEPFFTTKRPNEGTGLGLAMVYGIMHQHGGTIEVDSSLDRGTTFRLYFPAADDDDDNEYTEGMVTVAPAGSEQILVVEDEAVVRRVLVSMLRRNGYQVIAAATPSEALEAVADPSLHIDLLVSDVVMPEMSGVEMFERMRELRPALPVLYVSGYAHDVVTNRGVEAVHLLQKPFSQREMTARIRSLLGG